MRCSVCGIKIGEKYAKFSLDMERYPYEHPQEPGKYVCGYCCWKLIPEK